MNYKLGREIKQIDNLITRSMIATLKHKGINLTPVQYWVLVYLYKNKGTVDQKEIETLLAIRRSTTTGILQIMEKNDLIKRMGNSGDARKLQIMLTDKANDIIKVGFNCINDFEIQLQNNISIQELEVFFSVLSVIKQNLENIEKRGFDL